MLWHRSHQLNIQKIISRKLTDLVKEAAENIIRVMIIFPETFMSRFPAGTDIATANAVAEPLDGEFVQGMKKLAADHDVWLTFGMKETIEDPLIIAVTIQLLW